MLRRIDMKRPPLTAVLLIVIGGSSQAADICKGVALRDVPAVENPESILHRGEYDTAITQYRVRKRDGFAVVCSHGGYCYPANAIKLTNCVVGAKSDYNDDEATFFPVDVIRSKVPKALLRYDDLDNRLLEMGLCSACAGNAATLYLEKPHSQCAQVVRRALEGDPDAAKALQNEGYDRFCPFPYR